MSCADFGRRAKKRGESGTPQTPDGLWHRTAKPGGPLPLGGCCFLNPRRAQPGKPASHCLAPAHFSHISTQGPGGQSSGRKEPGKQKPPGPPISSPRVCPVGVRAHFLLLPSEVPE